MKKYFKGERREIDPKKLIRTIDEKNEKMENFFLGLGVFFNDLKSLLILREALEEVYEKPQKDEVSAHAGNYYGLMVYTEKMMVSTIYEFFKLIKEHQEILENSSEFDEIKNSMGNTELDIWERITEIASGSKVDQDQETRDFLKTLYIIRNRFGFHYDCEDRHFRPAYMSLFFGEMKHQSNKNAYYSFGETITDTRFFFSDASLEEALYLAVGKEFGKDSRGDVLIENFRNNIIETVQFVSPIVATLLKQFIAHRRNLPH